MLRVVLAYDAELTLALVAKLPVDLSSRAQEQLLVKFIDLPGAADTSLLAAAYIDQQRYTNALASLQLPTHDASGQSLEQWADAQDAAVRGVFEEGGVPRGMRNLYRSMFVDEIPLRQDVAGDIHRRPSERYTEPGAMGGAGDAGVPEADRVRPVERGVFGDRDGAVAVA